LDPVDHDQPEPGAERAVAPTLEPRNFADQNREDFLDQILDLALQLRDSSNPIADQRLMHILEPPSFGGIGHTSLQPIAQAARCHHHILAQDRMT
jgi:hypothetical protein